MVSLFLAVDSPERLDRAIAQCVLLESASVEVILALDIALFDGLEIALPSEIKFVGVPFVNGLPYYSRADMSRANAEFVGFSDAHGASLLPGLPHFSNDHHCYVLDWIASDEAFVPFRHERSVRAARDYGSHTLTSEVDLARLLALTEEPAWLSVQTPVCWICRQWLLDSELDTPLSASHWLHHRMQSALRNGAPVRVHFAPRVASLVVAPRFLSRSQAVHWAERDAANWLGLLVNVYKEPGLLRDAVWQLIGRQRPLFLSERANMFFDLFRQHCPDAPSMRELCSHGQRWKVCREQAIDRVQCVSLPFASAWQDKLPELRLATAKREPIRIDNMWITEVVDLILIDAAGNLLPLIAMYVDPDGRWVLPGVLAAWSGQACDRLGELLDTVHGMTRANELSIQDDGLLADLQRCFAGRFVPGLLSCSVVVGHAQRYEWVVAQGALGRVLDCTPNMGFGWHMLHKAGSLTDYLGLEQDAEARRFSARVVPAEARHFRLEPESLALLPQASFDTVIAFELLQRADDPELVLWDLAERLAPNGRIFLSVTGERQGDAYLNDLHMTHWNEMRLRGLCERVFERIEWFRLQSSTIAPSTLQTDLLRVGAPEPGEDEGFAVVLGQPRRRSLRPRVVLKRHEAMGDVLLMSGLLPALRRRYPDRSLVVKTSIPSAFHGEANVDVLGSLRLPARADDILIDLDRAYESRRSLHILDAYAEVAAVEAAGPHFYTTSYDYRPLARAVCKAGWFDGESPRHIVAIHMAATSPFRIWPQSYWSVLIQRLSEMDAGIVLLGSGSDYDIDSLTDAMRGNVLSLVRRSALSETAAALSVADFLVAPDSGLIHVASAVGTPVIGLFGMAEPALRLPRYGAATGLIADIECKGCLAELPPDALPLCRRGHAYCMDELRPSEVFDACQRMLASLPGHRWRTRLLQSIALPYAKQVASGLQDGTGFAAAPSQHA